MMLRRIYFITLLTISAFLTILQVAQAGDGIPDNCEYTSGAYYHANLFPRYEPQNQRLVLVDWATGADQLVLAEGLGDTRILGWSLDCQYLAAAVGPLTSMDTVVWNTTTGARIGSVADAHKQPHHITWGPNDFLVVETRDGAVLWNVPVNIQFTVNSGFNTTTSRNFSRLRWDAAHNQLIVNLAVGGRAVYDLNTGAEVPLAEHTADIIPGASPNTILIGGKNYECQNGYRYGYRNWFSQSGITIPNVRVDYNITDHMIVLLLTDQQSPYEVLEVLDTDVHASSFNFRGWSPGCRYAAASLGIPGHKATDTVVWDIQEKRRVGVFPDARNIQHPVHWSPAGDELVVETRDGAYLWYLPTDAHILLTSTVETALAGTSGIRSFYDEPAWNGNAILAVTVENSQAVTAYDIHTGAQIGVYAYGGEHGPVDFVLSPDGSRIAVFRKEDGILSVWNRQNNSSLTFHFAPDDEYWFPVVISPDNHYLAVGGNGLLIWDLQNPNADGSATIAYEKPFSYEMTFVDNVTLQASGVRMNILTGERSYQDTPNNPAPTVNTPVDGLTGMSSGSYGTYFYFRYEGRRVCDDLRPQFDNQSHQLMLVNTDTKEIVRVLETSLNPIFSLDWSPDCRFIFGGVAYTTSGTLPYDANPLDDTSYSYFSESVVFWDSQTGERLQTFANPYEYETYSAIVWSPGGERAIIRTTEGFFLYYPASNQAVLLTYPEGHSNGITTYFQTYWDYQRGQVLVSGWGGIYAFDMLTGVGRYVLTSAITSGGGNFSVSDDNQFLFIGGFSAVGLWNLDTLQHWQVDIRWETGYVGNRIALSPDGRYLVIARSMIRVWDLQNLPEEFDDRDPVYSYKGPETDVRSVHFIDNTIIETTASYGIVQRWDILTGALVSDL